MSDKKKHVFGPVFSRRLGRSLGVDVIPYKTCTYDCIYCQIGRTTNKTARPGEYCDADAVIADVRDALAHDTPDYVTFSGSGEPTLESRLGKMIAAVKKFSAVPVCVITNGSLLWMPEVGEACAAADVVVPSLDAATPEIFERINRPHPDVTFARMFDGLAAFREMFTGVMRLEIMFVAGVNESEVEALAAAAERIRPDRIELNTPVRPPAEAFAKPLAPEKLQEYAALFTPQAEVVTYNDHAAHPHLETAAKRAAVLDMLARRPSSLTDMESGLGMHPNEAVKILDELITEGKISVVERGGVRYFMPV